MSMSSAYITWLSTSFVLLDSMARRTMAAKGEEEAVQADPRFSMDAWENKESTRPSKRDREEDEEVEEEEEDEEDEVGGDEMDENEEEAMAGPILTTEDLEEFKKKQQKRGIIYVSRIPPGMTPAKVRHIFSQFGEVGRIYLQPKEKASSKKPKRASHFSEGWIEFQSKRVARTTAEMLNAQPIGTLGGSAHSSRRSHTGAGVVNRWKDDVWTMKYLKGFRWPMLMEQMSQERASHAARLRMELSQSAHEQRDYLKKVERSRVQREKEAKRIKRGEAPSEAVAPTHTYQQRAPVYRDVRDQRTHKGPSRTPASGGADMDKVLSQIF